MPERPEDKLSRPWGRYYVAKAEHDEKNIPLYAMQCLEHIQRTADSVVPDECAKVIQNLSLGEGSKTALQTYQELLAEAGKLGHQDIS